MYTNDLLLVANTYPALKKSIIDNEKGKYISRDLAYIKKYEYNSNLDYMFDFNIALNKFIADCHDNPDAFYIEHGVSTKANMRFYEIIDSYYLYVLKTEYYFILLNYGKITDLEYVHKIPHFKRHDWLSRNIRKEGKFYTVTNTYDSLLSFSEINGIKPNLNANELFYDCFFSSIVDIDLKLSTGEVKSAVDVINSAEKRIFKGFNFIVIDDFKNEIIIILDYYETVFKL